MKKTFYRISTRILSFYFNQSTNKGQANFLFGVNHSYSGMSFGSEHVKQEAENANPANAVLVPKTLCKSDLNILINSFKYISEVFPKYWMRHSRNNIVNCCQLFWFSVMWSAYKDCTKSKISWMSNESVLNLWPNLWWCHKHVCMVKVLRLLGSWLCNSAKRLPHQIKNRQIVRGCQSTLCKLKYVSNPFLR